MSRLIATQHWCCLKKKSRKFYFILGFSLGSTIQSKTKGIWAWCRPHPTRKGHCLLLLDTEGLGDVEKMSYFWYSIFAHISITKVFDLQNFHLTHHTFSEIFCLVHFANRVILLGIRTRRCTLLFKEISDSSIFRSATTVYNFWKAKAFANKESLGK